jgi:hypothetical protein
MPLKGPIQMDSQQICACAEHEVTTLVAAYPAINRARSPKIVKKYLNPRRLTMALHHP